VRYYYTSHTILRLLRVACEPSAEHVVVVVRVLSCCHVYMLSAGIAWYLPIQGERELVIRERKFLELIASCHSQTLVRELRKIGKKKRLKLDKKRCKTNEGKIYSKARLLITVIINNERLCSLQADIIIRIKPRAIR
jgi:hypothetical protein